MTQPFIDVDAPRLPLWMTPEARDALISGEDPPSTAIAAGRLTRGGAVNEALVQHVSEALATLAVAPLETAAIAALERCEAILSRVESGESPSAEDVWQATADRDDVESLLWSLGLAGRHSELATDAERRVLARAREVDTLGRQHGGTFIPALAADLNQPSRVWLAPLADASEPVWWLSPFAAGEAARLAGTWFSGPLLGANVRSLPLPTTDGGALSFATGGASNPDEILARPLGAPVAALSEGAVLVHAHGLADHDDEVPAGLVVRPADGVLDHLKRVVLEPAAASAPVRSETALAWWVPLSGIDDATPRHLIVEWDEGEGSVEDTLALEPAGRDEQ